MLFKDLCTSAYNGDDLLCTCGCTIFRHARNYPGTYMNLQVCKRNLIECFGIRYKDDEDLCECKRFEPTSFGLITLLASSSTSTRRKKNETNPLHK